MYYRVSERLGLDGSNRHVRFVLAFFGEHHDTVNQSKERVVFAHADIFAGIVACAALANDDVACFGELTAKYLQSESLAFRLTTVLRTTYTFLMCHFLLIFRVTQQFR